jgi:hypothetical protein
VTDRTSPNAHRAATSDASCDCWTCLRDVPTYGGMTLADTTFVVCSTCGNKRCPHATDHRLTCTNSNAMGQPGSRYA